MDLPFLNTTPQGAPGQEPGGSDFWGPTGAAGVNDDATLNDLLALYQSANDPGAGDPYAVATVPAAHEADPFAATLPDPFGGAMADPFAASVADPFAEAPVSDPFGGDSELDALIKNFQTIPGFEEAPAAEPAFMAPAPAPEPAFMAPAPVAPPVQVAPRAPAPEPAFMAPAPVAPPVQPAPPAPAPEPAFMAPAPAPVAPPPAPAAPMAPVAPPMAPVAAPAPVMKPAMPSVASAVMPPMGMPEVRLATREERQVALSHLVSAVNQLTSGIDQVQTQLATLYEGLAQAAATRAPIAEIVSKTEQLTATKGQVAENSPLWQQALMMRHAADMYLEFLRTL